MLGAPIRYFVYDYRYQYMYQVVLASRLLHDVHSASGAVEFSPRFACSVPSCQHGGSRAAATLVPNAITTWSALDTVAKYGELYFSISPG